MQKAKETAADLAEVPAGGRCVAELGAREVAAKEALEAVTEMEVVPAHANPTAHPSAA